MRSAACGAGTGSRAVVLPELGAAQGCEQNRFHRFDVWEHTVATVEAIVVGSESARIRRWSALVHDIGKPAVRHRKPNGEWGFYRHETVGSKMVADLMERLHFARREAQVIELLGRLRKELGMAVVLITHDLAVVAGFCEEVVVMYAGYIVEQTSVGEIFHNPRHPYTIGLLGSMPGTDTETGRGNRLNAIQGAPPDLTALPDGCPFAPRCAQ